ncbi:IQ motif-containing protein H [Aplochiton taeniatus]
MADILKNTDKLGNVLVQVQDDLRQLKRSLGRIIVNDKGESLDIAALDSAIRRTESGIRRQAEEYLKTVNKQVLTLPSIEDLEKKRVQISKWKPPLEVIPDMRPQKGQIGASPGVKHKAAFTMRLLCNPVHPKNRAQMHQSYGVQLPDVHKKSEQAVAPQRVVIGPTVGSLAVVPGGLRHSVYLTPPLSEDDMREGLTSLLDKGLPPAAADLCLFRTPVHHKAALLHHREDTCSFKMGRFRSRDFNWCPSCDFRHRFSSRALTERKSGCQKELNWGVEPEPPRRRTAKDKPSAWTSQTPPPSVASKMSDDRIMTRGTVLLTPIHAQDRPEQLPGAARKLFFVILEGQIDSTAPDLCGFKQHYCLCWGAVLEALLALERLLRDYAVPTACVNGERLVELAQGGGLNQRGPVPLERLLSVLENREEVWDLVFRPGQRYKGKGGTEAAAVRIQTCWRRHFTRSAYLRNRRERWASATIGISWLMHAQRGRVRKALQATRFRQLESYRCRAEHLAANWKHMQSSRRTIIHVPSLGYSQAQRFGLKDFDILQNIQIGRLCEVRDGNVEVIYVSPVHLGNDLIQYYAKLLELRGATGVGVPAAPQPSSCIKRFTIITPEALDSFPTHDMCLSSLLKYSPRSLKRIRNLIQGKQAYMVGGVTHADDLAVADELGVPILGPEPAVAQLYGTKSGGRRICVGAGVSVPPGQWDIYTTQQLHDTLTQLMTDHLDVKRWLFKMDAENGGRGMAYCDVSHLSCHSWAQQEGQLHSAEMWTRAWVQESVRMRFLEEVPEWLACHGQPVRNSAYPTWVCFLENFLRQGGVVEAYPPSDSVTCLTVDLLLEPGGQVTMLSCGDQLHGPSELESVGSTLPQTSVSPDVLGDICMRVGRACLQRLIVGHVSLDLATFLDPRTLEQKVRPTWLCSRTGDSRSD